MHVRSFGLVRDLTQIETIAHTAGVPLVVDSAAGFGGVGGSGVPVGRAGRAEVFSFHATKTFSVGEGGVVLADPDLAAEVALRANFSLDGQDVTGDALNAKMSEVTAAISLAMLGLLDDHIGRRAALVARLHEALAEVGIEGDAPVDAGRPAWQTLPVLLADVGVRERVVEGLAREGVEARRYYAPGLHLTTAFADCAVGPLPVTEELSARMLCLPLYSDLSESDTAAYLGAVTRGLHRAVASERTRA
jgi:dTDP-4-amino-4,6-dideoxygalactose transaminase